MQRDPRGPSGSVLGLRQRLRKLTGKDAKDATEEARSYLQFTYDMVQPWPRLLEEALSGVSSQPKPDQLLSLLVTVSKMHKVIKERGGINASGGPASFGEPIGTSDWTKVGPMLGDSIQARGKTITQDLTTYRETVVSKLGERILPYSTEKPKDTVVSPNLLAKFKNAAFRDERLEAQSSCMTKIFFFLDQVRRLVSMRLLVWVLEKSEGAYNTWQCTHDAQQAISLETQQLWTSYRRSLLDIAVDLYPFKQGDSPASEECKNIAKYFFDTAEFILILLQHSPIDGIDQPKTGLTPDNKALQQKIAKDRSRLVDPAGIKKLYNDFADKVNYKILSIDEGAAGVTIVKDQSERRVPTTRRSSSASGGRSRPATPVVSRTSSTRSNASLLRGATGRDS
jgi:hypothetical protein